MHNSLDFIQLGILRKGAFNQLHQPRADDRAIVPYPGHLFKIKIIAALLQHLKAFPNGSHHPVLNSVVDHLQKMAAAGLAGI
ncbi:hypothetical protein D3C75_995750 [compost metagenome]